MFFPISGAHISPIYLTVIGFVIGVLGGFFGVGNAHLEEFAAPFARTVPRRFASGIHSGSVSETS